METKRVVTLGEERVGVSSNPSADPVVDKIKTLSAELIDLHESMRTDDKGNSVSSEKHRTIAIAQSGVETACMYAVKSVFKK